MPTGKLRTCRRTVSHTHAPPVTKPSSSAQVTASFARWNSTVFSGFTSQSSMTSSWL